MSTKRKSAQNNNNKKTKTHIIMAEVMETATHKEYATKAKANAGLTLG
jgi:hypothetical protein